jgi:hypothetical protein
MSWYCANLTGNKTYKFDGMGAASKFVPEAKNRKLDRTEGHDADISSNSCTLNIFKRIKE